MYSLHVGDYPELLQGLADNSVHCCITSPPYYNLRDYHNSRQIGLERTPDAFIQSLVAVFRQVRRVLRPDGTLWLNIGDTYAKGTLPGGVKKKDLIGIPWMLAFALRADGWHLRCDVIWSKPNGTPESIKDRPSRSHEYVFLLTKQTTCYYDREAVREPNVSKKPTGRKGALLAMNGRNGGKWAANADVRGGFVTWNPRGRNKRTVWSIPTASFRPERLGITDVDHFALFPPALVLPCLLAGTSQAGCCPMCGAPWRRVVGETDDPAEDGWRQACECAPAAPIPCTVVDPFGGSCTTGVVSIEEGRNFIGFELNPDYARLGQARLDDAVARMAVKRGEA